MLITILNGEPSAGTPFDRYVGEVAGRLRADGHGVTQLDLRGMEIRSCTGCFGCWVKTPGECLAHDDSADVCRAVITSDFTLFAAPMVMGFTSALLKRTTDKLIPLIHPYIIIEGGEMHHAPRYQRYPLLGLLLGADPDTDAEDLEITEAAWSRTARNLKSSLAFVAVDDRPIEEVSHEFAAAA
jgi:hypothetical protein